MIQDGTFDSPMDSPRTWEPAATESEIAEIPRFDGGPAVLEEPPAPIEMLDVEDETEPDMADRASEPAVHEPEPTLGGARVQAGELTRGRRRDLEGGTSSLDTVKVVYWGPGRSGKTTNLQWLHSKLRPEMRGDLVAFNGPGERTLYFDCLPLDLSSEHGAPVQLRLYTVPGQPRFRLTRKIVLDGVDGIVFVWDARSRRLNANLAALIEMRETLAELGASWSEIPMIFQYNKLDLPDAIPPDQLDHVLNRMGERGRRIHAVATEGTGVLDTLGGITTAALRRYRALSDTNWMSAAAGL